MSKPLKKSSHFSRPEITNLGALFAVLTLFLSQMAYSQIVTITNITDYSETSTPAGNCVISGDSDVSKKGVLLDATSYGTPSWGLDKINGVRFVRFPSTGGLNDDRLKNPGKHIYISIGGDTQLAGNYSSSVAPFNNLSNAYKSMLSTGTYRNSGYKTYVGFGTLEVGVEYEFQLWINDPNYVGNYQGSLVTIDKNNGGTFRFLDNGQYVTKNSIKVSKNNSGKKGGLGTFITGKFTADSENCSIVINGLNPINGIQFRQVSSIPQIKYDLNFNNTTISNGPLPTDWKVTEDGQVYSVGSESWRGWNTQEQGAVRPTISTNIKREGSGALFTQLNPPTASQSQRTEVRAFVKDANFYHQSVGEENFYGFSFRLEPGFQDPQGWFNIHQVKQRRSPYIRKANIPFIQFGFYDGSGFLQYKAISMQRTIKPKRGVWYDVVIGWKFSPQTSDGFVACWIKEASAENYTKFERRNIRVGENDKPYSTHSHNFGMYKKAEQRAYKMYFDAVKIGKTFESVRIKPDSGNPVVSFNKPTASSFNEGDNLSVDVKAVGNGGIAKVDLYFDGVFVRKEGFAPYTWNATGQNDPLLNNLKAGTHTLRAVATDNSGETGEMSMTITVQPEVPPVADIANGVYYIQNPDGSIKINSPSGRSINKSNTTGNSAKWQVTKVGTYYTIKNLRNNEYLEVPYAACEMNKTPNNPTLRLGTYTSTSGNHQRWSITKVGSDYFLRPLHCDKVIDRNGDPNGEMLLWSYSQGNPNQNWRLVSSNATSSCNWIQQSGKALDIASNGSHVYRVGTDGYIYKLNSSGGWSNPDRTKKIKRIDVGANGDVWAIGEDNKVWQYKYPSGPWLDKNGTGIDIGVSNSVVYVIGLDNKVRKYTGLGTYSAPLGTLLAKRLDVHSSDRPWVVATNNGLYQWLLNDSWGRKGTLNVLDVGINPTGGDVMVTAADQTIQFYVGNGVYRKLSGRAVNVTVGTDAIPWVVNAVGNVYKRGCKANARISNDLESSTQSSISIYPNPVKGDHFTIELGEKSSEISILDLQGKEVYRTETDQTRVQLSRSILGKNGLYVVKIEYDGMVYTRKLILH